MNQLNIFKLNLFQKYKSFQNFEKSFIIKKEKFEINSIFQIKKKEKHMII